MTVFAMEVLAALFVVVALALAITALLPSSSRSGKHQRPWRRLHSPYVPQHDLTSMDLAGVSRASDASPADFSDVGVQLKAIMAAAFERRRVMNRSEYKVFKVVEQEVAAAKKGCRAFAQTSLGQVLASPSAEAFRSINAKRVDILVVDGGGWPVFAVEYQGPGHYQGTAAARDAIKKEALRRAGVGYLEVTPSDEEELVRIRIREYLGVKGPGPKEISATPIGPFHKIPHLH